MTYLVINLVLVAIEHILILPLHFSICIDLVAIWGHRSHLLLSLLVFKPMKRQRYRFGHVLRGLVWLLAAGSLGHPVEYRPRAGELVLDVGDGRWRCLLLHASLGHQGIVE